MKKKDEIRSMNERVTRFVVLEFYFCRSISVHVITRINERKRTFVHSVIRLLFIRFYYRFVSANQFISMLVSKQEDKQSVKSVFELFIKLSNGSSCLDEL